MLFIQAICPCSRRCSRRSRSKEPIDKRAAIALATAIGGVALMLGAPGAGNREGDVLALVMATAFAVALVISRHRKDVSMAPATFLSQLILVGLLGVAAIAEVPRSDIPELAAIGAGQIGLGLALLTMGGGVPRPRSR